MTLRPTLDVSAADWWVDADADWPAVALLGPPGYEGYVRILHPLDGPPVDGDPYVQVEGHLEDALLTTLVEVLSRHTATADDCCFGLWDGFGAIQGGEAVGLLTLTTGPDLFGRIFRSPRRPSAPPAFPTAFLQGPRVSTPGRDYLLFRGALHDAGRWGAMPYGPGAPPRDINSPSVMWPVDRAWFVATEIDSAWTGVGGSRALVHALLDHPDLDVVEATYGPDQPEYR